MPFFKPTFHPARCLVSAFFILSLLGCSLLSRLPFREDASSFNPTRTPFPTFTPTAPLPPLISVLPTPTEATQPTPTPIPPTSPPPQPTEPPPPEPTSTDTLEPAPTEPRRRRRQRPPPPTEPPPASRTGGPAPTALLAKLPFEMAGIIMPWARRFFVKIEATNVGDGLKPFGILGLTPSSGNFQTMLE